MALSFRSLACARGWGIREARGVVCCCVLDQPVFVKRAGLEARVKRLEFEVAILGRSQKDYSCCFRGTDSRHRFWEQLLGGNALHLRQRRWWSHSWQQRSRLLSNVRALGSIAGGAAWEVLWVGRCPWSFGQRCRSTRVSRGAVYTGPRGSRGVHSSTVGCAAEAECPPG